VVLLVHLEDIQALVTEDVVVPLEDSTVPPKNK
jgi:hypothetical protein